MSIENRRPEIDHEIDSILAKLGRNISVAAFREYVFSANTVDTVRHRRALVSRFKTLSIQALIDRVAAQCRASPTISDVATILNSDPGPDRVSAKWAHALLKEQYPQLWEEGSTAVLCVRVKSKDRKLIELCSKTVGCSLSEAISVVHRALLLASYRGEINLLEVLSSAKSLSAADLEILDRMPVFTLKNVSQ